MLSQELGKTGKRPMIMELFAAIVVLYFLVIPSLTLLHELGHAIVPYFWEGAKVSVRVGPKLDPETTSPWLHLQSDRFELRITNLWKPWQGYCGWSFVSTYKERIAALFLGPLVSFVSALLAAIILYYFWGAFSLLPKFLCFGALGFALIQFSVTAIPMTYPKFSRFASNSVSDGKQITYLYNRYHRGLASTPNPIPKTNSENNP